MNKKYFFRDRPFWKSEKVRWAGTIAAVVLLISVFTVQNQELWQNNAPPDSDNLLVGQNGGVGDSSSTGIDLLPEPAATAEPETGASTGVSTGAGSASVTATNGDQSAVNIETEAAAVSAPPSTWLAPSSGVYGRGYGYSYDSTYEDYRFHSGIDMQLEMGELVLAVADGKVTKVADDSLWGGRVEIEHAGGMTSVYLGVVPSGIKEGQEIQAGETVGTVAPAPTAEAADGAHLHLELLLDGNSVDPLKYLR